MFKTIAKLLLLFAIPVAAQTHTYPALDTNNTFTGTNTFNGAVTFNSSVTGLNYGSLPTMSGSCTITISGVITCSVGSTNNINGGVTGSLPYQNGISTTSMLAPNTTTTRQFLCEAGTGSSGNPPAWCNILSGDLTTSLTTPPPIGGVTPNTAIFSGLASGCSLPVSGINSINVNGVLNPGCFLGSDMGAQINSAYSTCVSGAMGCVIKVGPGSYNITTPIQIMTKGIGTVIECGSTNTVLQWTPTSGTMFQFASGGAGTSTWSSGIRNCTLVGPTTGTSTAVVLGVSNTDSTGRTAQGVSISDSNINGFNIQFDLESQSWNNTISHTTFNNAITNEVYYNPTAVNSGENIHFLSDTFDVTSTTFLLNGVNLGLLSAYTTFTSSNFDNVQLTNNGGEISFNGLYFEDPNTTRGSSPFINLQTGVTEGTNLKAVNQFSGDTSPVVYNKGTFSWTNGEIASTGATPLAVKNDVHGHSFIAGDISVVGQLVDNSTTDAKSIDITPGFGMNLNRTPFSITDSNGGSLVFHYTNAGTLTWNFGGNGFEIKTWGPNSTTPGNLTFAGLANDGSHAINYAQFTPTLGTIGLPLTVNGNTILNGNLDVTGNIPNGVQIGTPPIGLFKGASGAFVVTPSSGASIDIAVNNAAQTQNSLIVFDNGDACVGTCNATDPGFPLSVKDTGNTSHISIESVASALGVGNEICNELVHDGASFNGGSICYTYQGAGVNTATIGLGLYANDNLLKVNGKGTVQILPTSGTSYEEGLRISPASDDYSMFAMAASPSSNSGTQVGQWTWVVTPNSGTLVTQRALELDNDGTVEAGFTTANGGGTPTLGLHNLSGATGVGLCLQTGGPTAFNNLIASCTSLRKYKDHILPLRSALAEIAKLRPVSYSSKLDHDQNGRERREIGFIAEEVEKVDPRLSTYDADGKLRGVEYSHFASILTAAIQEQQREIEELKVEVKALQNTSLKEETSSVTFLSGSTNKIYKHPLKFYPIKGSK